jgi:hypothetical protein
VEGPDPGMSGAMWQPAERLAEAGVIAIVCCNTPGYVASGAKKSARDYTFSRGLLATVYFVLRVFSTPLSLFVFVCLCWARAGGGG